MCKNDWNSSNSHYRHRHLMNLFDYDIFVSGGSETVFKIYKKSHYEIIVTRTPYYAQYYFDHIDYIDLLKIFDLMEKYAKIWSFS